MNKPMKILTVFVLFGVLFLGAWFVVYGAPTLSPPNGNPAVIPSYFTLSGTNLYPTSTSYNLGIGTTGPGEKLEVYGNVKLSNATITSGVRALTPTGWGYSPNAYRVVQVGAASGNESVAIGYNPSVNANGSFTGDGSEVIFRRGVKFWTPNTGNTGWFNNFSMLDGKVGIGTADPGTAGLAVMSGSVGIGTTTPAYPLTVNGVIYSVTGGFRFPDGTTQTTAGAVISAANVSSDVFGRLQGNGNFAFPAGLGIGTSTTAGMPTNGLYVAGNVGIGTTSPNGKLDVNAANATIGNWGNLTVRTSDSQAINLGGSISFGGVYTGTSAADWATIAGRKENGTGSNYAGYLQFGTRTQGGNTAERMRIDSTGNVGIGTTSPGTFLQVAGTSAKSLTGYFHTAITDLTTMGTGVGGGITFVGYKTAQSALEMFAGIDGYKENATAGNAAGAMRLFTQETGAGLVERMRITSTGNVGIGTTGPLGKLVVNGTGSTDYGATNPVLSIQAVTTNQNLIKIQGVTNTDSYIGRLASSDDLTFGFVSPAPAWGHEAMRILASNGNVGIGTTTPSLGKLQVAGGAITIDNNQWFNAVNAAGSGVVNLIKGDTSNNIQIGSTIVGGIVDIWNGYSTRALRITGNPGANGVVINAGNVGIGVTAPANPLEVVGSARINDSHTTGSQIYLRGNSSGGEIGTQTNHPLYLVANAQIAQTILANGNVGIGTTTPAYKLDIVGAAHTDTISISGIATNSQTGITPLFYGGSNTTASLYLDSITSGSVFYGRRAGTSQAARSNVGNGQGLLDIRSAGFSGATGYWDTAQIGFVVDAAVTDNQRPPSRISFSTNVDGGTVTERMRIDRNGNVGINTSNITAKLSIWGDIIVNQVGTNKGVIRADNTSLGTGGAIQLSANNTASNQYVAFGTTPSGASGEATFTELMRVLSSGNVGIGTTTPQAKLDVAGAIFPSLHSSYNLGSLTKNWWTVYANNYNSSGDIIFNPPSPASAMIIKNSTGNVGIATTTPGSPLTVAGVVYSSTGGFKFPDGTTQATASTGGGTNFWTLSGSNLYPTSTSYNVGIGTTTPAAKLDVAGQVRAAGPGGGASFVAPYGGGNTYSIGNTGSGYAIKNSAGVVMPFIARAAGDALNFGTDNNYRLRFVASSSLAGVLSAAGNWNLGTTEQDATVRLNVEGAVNAAGVIYSSTGGFKFPNGTTQTTGVNLVYKTADETVNNSTTYQDDDHLVKALGANETWTITYYLRYSSSAVADFKHKFTVPSGTTGWWTAHGNNGNYVYQWRGDAITDEGTQNSGDSVKELIILVAYVKTSSTAGNITLQWAQNTAEVSNTVLSEGSYLEAKKLN